MEDNTAVLMALDKASTITAAVINIDYENVNTK